MVRGILLKERPISAQDDMVAWCYIYPRLNAFREMNIKAITLLYTADQRSGAMYPLQDQHYIHSTGPEHGHEFFAHNHDSHVPPTYYTPHEEYGHEYAHSFVQPHFHLEPDSEILPGGAQKNGTKNQRFTPQYL